MVSVTEIKPFFCDYNQVKKNLLSGVVHSEMAEDTFWFKHIIQYYPNCSLFPANGVYANWRSDTCPLYGVSQSNIC